MSRDPHLHFEYSFEEEPEEQSKAKGKRRKPPQRRDPEDEPGLLWKQFRKEG